MGVCLIGIKQNLIPKVYRSTEDMVNYPISLQVIDFLAQRWQWNRLGVGSPNCFELSFGKGSEANVNCHVHNSPFGAKGKITPKDPVGIEIETAKRLSPDRAYRMG